MKFLLFWLGVIISKIGPRVFSQHGLLGCEQGSLSSSWPRSKTGHGFHYRHQLFFKATYKPKWLVFGPTIGEVKYRQLVRDK